MRIILFCLFLSIIIPTQAQKRFKPGFVVTTNFDTLRGKIKDWKIGSLDDKYPPIKFKNERGKRKKFQPHEMAFFQSGSDLYECLAFRETFVRLRSYRTITSDRNEIRYLKVVERGYLTCYHQEFLESEFGNPDYLVLYKRQTDPYLIPATQGIFGLKRKRLIQYFQDCPPLVAKIQSKSIKDPLEVVRFYNQWHLQHPK
jgi:hypothetical protein